MTQLLPWFVAAALAIVVLLLARRLIAKYLAARTFVADADRWRLDREERALLGRVADATGLANHSRVFTDEKAFEQGLQALMAGKAVAAMSEQARGRLAAIVESLRAKLGFYASAPEFQQPATTEDVPIPAGTDVALFGPSSTEAIPATVDRAVGDDVVVSSRKLLDARAGDAWRLRYVAEGTQWLYDVVVKEASPQAVTFRFVNKPKSVNLRRFVRVPTNKPAYVAPFPFARAAERGSLPEFVAGTLTEIGGPGLRIQLPLRTQSGDRVLAVVQTDPHRVVQSPAIVRRAAQGADRQWETIVEMTGLKESEVGELVRATNSAAKQSGEPEPATVAAETSEN